MGAGLTQPGPTMGLQDTEPIGAGRTHGKDRQADMGGHTCTHTAHTQPCTL